MSILLVFVYLFCVFCFLCNLNKDLFLKTFLLLIPIPVAFFDPIAADMYSGNYVDTVRMFAEMDALRSQGWDVWTPYDNLLGSKIYLYFFAQLNNNYIMPIVTCFVVYLILLYAVKRVGRDLESENKIILLALISLILLMSYFNVVTNIRYPLAVALFSLVFVFDVLEGKSHLLCFLGYAIIANIHSGVLLLIGIRYIAHFKLKISLMILSFGLLAIYTEMYTIINYMLQNDSGLLYQIASKQAAYEDYTRSFTPAFRLSCGVIDVGVFVLACYYRKKCGKYLSTVVINAGIILSVLGFYTSFSNTLLGNVMIQRIESFTIFFMVIIYMVLYMENRRNWFIKFVYYSVMSYVFLFQVITLQRI